MALNKKGVFFTLIAVLLVTIVIVSFAFYSTYRTKSKMFVVETRVNTMDRFVDDLETDIDRAVYIAGFRAVLGALDNIIATGIYLNDSQSALGELMAKGTLNNEQLNLTIDSSISDWFDRAKIQGQSIGLDMNYAIRNYSVKQTSPWYIDFNLEIEFYINDSKGIAQYNRTKTTTKQISISGLEDPLYTIGSYGRTNRLINKTNMTIDSIEDLEDFLDSEQYRANSDAPSYLMRLEGNLSSSPYGIETLVNTNELFFYELTLYDRSSVDYIYFGTKTTSDYNIHNITDDEMPGFKLDQEHIDEFNVNDYKY